jgi:hypothetical protein
VTRLSAFRLSDPALRQVLAWLVIVLLVVPVGGALWLGVAHRESPCILCWAQRTSMVLIALVTLFIVRWGPRPRYLGMLVLLGSWGLFMSLRHSALHLARDIGQGFAGAILGVHTYVWSAFIHWVVLLAAGALLVVVKGPLEARPGVAPGRAGRFAMALLVVLAGANAVQAFISTGPPPFVGQGDPVRLSLDPNRWVWSLADLGGGLSLRGSWSVPEPKPGDVVGDGDPETGPIVAPDTLPVRRWTRVPPGVKGTVTGFAAVAGRAVVVTDRYEVAMLEGDLSRVRHRVVIDRGFSVDLSTPAGAAFLGHDTVAVVSTNKSYVLLRADPHADAAREWRHFLETDGTVTELRRSRFGTVRARQQYVLSLAYHSAAGELVTVSVPSERHPRLVVSRFDRGDWTLSSEFVPRLADGLKLRGPERGLHEYLVTGAAVVDGRLYALSARHSTLLVIDLEERSVAAVYAVPELERPVGLGFDGATLLIAQADGRVAVLESIVPESLQAAAGAASPARTGTPAGR